MFERSAALVDAARLERVLLGAAAFKGRPDAFSLAGPLTLGMVEPKVTPTCEPGRTTLRILVDFELQASRTEDAAPPRGRRTKPADDAGVRVLLIKATYFLEFAFDFEPASRLTQGANTSATPSAASAARL